MKVVVQRVKSASVSIRSQKYSHIEKGLLVLLGIEKNDTEKESEFLADKICKLRIFDDKNGKMNFSVKDLGAEVLVVSQFTLAGSCEKGTRPSFDNSASPSVACELYEKFTKRIITNGVKVQTGKFGAMMDVELINDGPVTFVLSR